MEPSTLHTQPKRPKPPKVWVLVTIIAGAAGALGAVAAGGKGTYDVAAFRVELRAMPAALGKTELAVRPEPPAAGVPRTHAEAGTHNAPLVVRATVVDVSGAVPSDLKAFWSPYDLASYLGDEGKDAAQRFALMLAGLAAAGGAGAGLLVSFGRWRRVVGGLAAGVLTFAVIGFLMQQTYDAREFQKTSFVSDDSQPIPSGLPT